MRERSDGIDSDAPASAPDALLATKLHLPHPRAGFVSRPRLLSVLDESPLPGIVLVCAPAGFGKTALLGEWVRRGGRPVAWLSLDTGDSGPGSVPAPPRRRARSGPSRNRRAHWRCTRTAGPAFLRRPSDRADQRARGRSRQRTGPARARRLSLDRVRPGARVFDVPSRASAARAPVGARQPGGSAARTRSATGLGPAHRTARGGSALYD